MDTARAMSEENVEIVRSILACWDRGDYGSTDWSDPDIEFVAPFDTIEARGIEELGRRWGEFLGAWENFATTPERFIDLGDGRVLVLVRFQGRGRVSGAPTADFSGGQLFTLRDGKVVRLVLYSTRAEALEAAGLSE
jgi:ketosteroid isomerase-like protein